jgi:hypothetical protein
MRRRGLSRLTRFSFISVFAAAGSVAIGAESPRLPVEPPLSVSSLSSLGGFTMNPLAAPSQPAISAYSLNTTPLAGFIPRVVVGLTDEWRSPSFGDAVGYGVISSSPGGQTLPVGQSPQYVMATIDTGAQAHIFSYAAAQAFNFAGANREGTKTIQVQGASGIESLYITDGVGVYGAGIQHAIGGSTLGVTAGTLKGGWNLPVLTAQEGSVIPSLLGAPLLPHWQVAIKNSQTRHVTAGGTTYRGPSITFEPINMSLPSGYSRLAVVTSDNGPPPDPFFINWDFTGADNPDSPAAWSLPMARANAAHTDGSVSNLQFLFDTGAQVSVISSETAAQVGFYMEGPNPSTPDFHVDVLGVGGIQSVPGFFMNSLSVTTTGGPITWNHVPVLVLDLANPANPGSLLPGILGMNLFTDRDLLVRMDIDTPGGTYIGIGPKITPQWLHTSGGTWSEDAKWSLGAPDFPDAQANLLNTITAPATIVVDDAGYTIGSMKFDSAHGYTISGSGGLVLQSFSNPVAVIHAASGHHAISAPIVLANDARVEAVAGASVSVSNVDLVEHRMTFKGGNLNEINNLVIGGRAGGSWTGTGITSSTAAASAATHGVGILASGGDVTVAYALLGDANLEGQVNIADLGILAANWQQSSRYWFHGDFNYDGTVNIADLGILAGNWQAGVSGGSSISFAEAMAMFDVFDGVVVPEPGAVGMIGLGMLMLMRRRKARI